MKGHLLKLSMAVSAFLFSCHHQAEQQKIAQYTQRLNPTDTLPRQLIIKDHSLYSRAFIDSLRKANYPGKIVLENNYMVVGKDTTRFPNDLEANKPYQFIAQKDSLTYRLNLIRLNLTDITFECNISKANKPIFRQQGTATLTPLFFLAAEAPEDEQTGETFSAYSYSTNSSDTPLVIKIGIGPDEHDRSRAVISGGKLPNQAPVMRTVKN